VNGQLERVRPRGDHLLVGWLALTLLALAATSCGGSGHTAASGEGNDDTYKIINCVPAAPANVPEHGYRICGRGPTGGSAPSRLVRGTTVEVAGPIGKVGHREKAFVSPDRKTLLAQWSEEC
jgi:hypothetical protein